MNCWKIRVPRKGVVRIHGQRFICKVPAPHLDGVALAFCHYHEAGYPTRKAYLWGTAEAYYCFDPEQHQHEQPELQDGVYKWAFWTAEGEEGNG